ncbi:ABC transporter substrate-binding protein [Ligilactobacillus apodemi]|nr:ABC transporter substrate-binding protein [Ligilactobacillus apodemi]
MKLKKMVTLLSVFALVSLTLSACAPKEDSVKKSSSTSKSEKTVSLNLGTMPAPDSLPLYVAKEKGYFKEEGLDVKLTSFKSPTERDAAISAGQLNGAVTDVVALASYVNGKLGWKSATALTGYFGIVTSDSSVKTVADLKGKTIATLSRQTPTFYLYQQLKKNGLSADDVTIKEVPSIPVRLQLVAQKQADATILPDPFLSMAKAQGLTEIAKSNPTKYQTTILALDKKTSQNKETVAKLTKAYNKAVAQINKHQASDYQTILTKNLSFPESVAKSYTLPHYTKAQKVAESTLKEAFEYAKSEGVLKENVDPAKYQLSVTD